MNCSYDLRYGKAHHHAPAFCIGGRLTCFWRRFNRWVISDVL